MPIESNLLKEAIADAKAVRQTALANAKAALEEAFDNKLQQIFAPSLEEETADSVAAPSIAAPMGEAPVAEEAVNETDIEEIIAELEADLAPQGQPPAAAPAVPPVGAAAPAPAPEVPPMGAPAPAPVPPMEPAAAAPAPEVPPPAPEEEAMMDEEINISELLESLKEESEKEDDKEEKKDGKGKPPWLKENAPVNTSGIGGGKAGGTDNKEPSADASKSSHIEDSGKSVKSATVGTPEHKQTSHGDDATKTERPNQGEHVTKDNQSTPGGALKENTGAPSTPGYPEQAKKTSGGKDPTEGVPRPNEGEHATKTDLSTVPSPLKENESLKNQLKEATDTVVYLRGQLNEINLLNAKLLYTNKLFKEYSMPNEKKMKVVEMFDLAKNVREVKMTYAVIAESLNFGAEPKRKVSKVQNITEGMASQPVAGTAPKQIITEGAMTEMKARFIKLANIKPSQPQPKK